MLFGSASDVAVAIGQKCAYCDLMIDGVERVGHWEHVVPRSRGGPDSPVNLVIACAPCNLSKGAKLPSEWLPSDRITAFVKAIETRVLAMYGATERQGRHDLRVEPVAEKPECVKSIGDLIERNPDTYPDCDADWLACAIFVDSEDYDWVSQMVWSAEHGTLRDCAEHGPEHDDVVRKIRDMDLNNEVPLAGISREMFEWALMEAAEESVFDALGSRWSHATLTDDSMTILLWDITGRVRKDEIDFAALDSMGEWSIEIIRVDDDGNCGCVNRPLRWTADKRIPGALHDSTKAKWTIRNRYGGLRASFERRVDDLYDEYCITGLADESVDDVCDDETDAGQMELPQ